MTIRELMDKLEAGEGTVKEAEHWLAELQRIDPYFEQSDHMLQLRDNVYRRRRAETTASEMDSAPSAAQIAALLESIDYESAIGGLGIEEMEARETVIDSIFPHPDTMRYLQCLIAEGTPMETAVRAALSYQPVATFHLPGVYQ